MTPSEQRIAQLEAENERLRADAEDARHKGAPAQVWISWCDACGKADYAFNRRPKPDDVAGCPRCETDGQYMQITGPYVLAGQAKQDCEARRA